MPYIHPSYRLGRATKRMLSVVRWWRSINCRDQIIAEWRRQWWYEIRVYVMSELMVTIGSALGVAVITGELFGRAVLGAVVGGLGAIVALLIYHAIQASVNVFRLIRHVNKRVKQRFVDMIRNGHLYLENPGFDPNHNRGMYEQHHRHAAAFASEVDRFLDRYYPQPPPTIMFARKFVNLDIPPFDDLSARRAHIDTLNSTIETGLAKLEELRQSRKRPKLTPFHIVG